MKRSIAFAFAVTVTALAASAPAQTTTSTTTTTTTLAGACGPGDTTLTGLRCRIEAFRDTLAGSTNLGRLQDGMVKRLEKALDKIDDAADFCGRGDDKRAGKAVQQSARHVQTTVAKINSNNGRKIIKPDSARRDLADQGDGLKVDLKSVRKSISCP